MGIDLLLLPMTVFPLVGGGEGACAYTTLALGRRSQLWPLVRALPRHPVPPFFETLVSTKGLDDEEPWRTGDTPIDAYGEGLTWVYAKDLMTLSEHPGVREHQENRAAWAYLAHLPLDSRVALFWH